MGKKFPTKAKLRARGIYNTHEVAHLLPEQRVWVVEARKMLIRSTVPVVMVYGINRLQTDPSAHWSDYGQKRFSIKDRTKKDETVAEAKRWAEENFRHSAEWVRDPFGGWHDARVLDIVLAKSAASSEHP